MKKYKIALYIRVSTEEQAENPEGSIKNQEERLRDFVKMKNYDGDFGEIIEVYCDPGISAKDMNRPSLQRLLRDIAQKKINLVMVTEISRLTRSTKDFAMLWDYLNEHECKFQSLRDNFDSTTPAGEMIMFTLANFAQFERKQLGERIANAFQARSKRGLWNGGVLPLGYDLDKEKPGHLKVIPAEAEVVQRIFETFLKEETLSRTGKALNAAGIKLPRKLRNGGGYRHSHFTIGNVYRILTNKAYIGIRVFKVKNETKESQAVWETIVDPLVFDRANRMLKENFIKRKKPSSPTRYPYILSGILHCGACGDRLCGKSANGNGGKIAYYEHAHFAKTKSLLSEKRLDCDPKRILADKIEPVVWKDAGRILTDQAYAKTIFKEAKAQFVKDKKPNPSDKIKNRILTLQVQTEALVKRIAELPKDLDAKPFYAQIRELQAETATEESKLESLKNETQESPICFEQFEKFTVDLRHLLESETRPEARASILRKLIARIEVHPTGITIHYHIGESHYFKEFRGKDASGSSSHLTKAITKPLPKYSLNFLRNFDSDLLAKVGSTNLTNGRECGD